MLDVGKKIPTDNVQAISKMSINRHNHQLLMKKFIS